MRLKPIKQIMNNKVDLGILAHGVDLHKNNLSTGKFKLADARKIANKQMKVNESDPHIFSRIVSRLMAGSMTPGDFNKSRGSKKGDQHG